MTKNTKFYKFGLILSIFLVFLTLSVQLFAQSYL